MGRNPRNTFKKINNQLRHRPFDSFRQKRLIVGCDSYQDHSQLQFAPPEADVYICGSDQIWNPNLICHKKDEFAFWLNFGSSNVIRVSYAPSFGVWNLTDDVCERYKQYVRCLDRISVREKNGLKLIEKLGRHDSVWVPDPTLLLKPEEYQPVEMNNKCPKRSYIFSYQLKIRTSPVSPAALINAEVCSNLKLSLYESYSLSVLYNILFKRYLNPGEWIYNIRNSSFVVTNSFHGTVFSLLFNRPFITILRNGVSNGMNSRIESLLEQVGLKHRAVKNFDRVFIKELCNEKIEWKHIDGKIEELREIGLKFLTDAIG